MKSLQRLTLFAVLTVLILGSTSFARTARHVGDAWMGVYTQSVTRDLVRSLDLKSNRGAAIIEVVEDSPADEAGLKEDDVILRVNGTQLDNTSDLTAMIEKAAPGDKMTLNIIRDGRDKEVVVTLGDRSESEESAYSISMPKLRNLSKIPQVFTFYNDAQGSFIGVTLMDLTSQLGDYFGIKGGNGVLINEVEKDSPAEKAGLRAGDVIVGIDGAEVTDSRDVREAVGDKKAGSTVSLDIVRDRQHKTFQVEIEKRSRSNSYSYSYDGNRWVMPSIPNLDNLHQSNIPGFDREEFHKQMEELRAQMRELRNELKNNESWREEMQKLKEDLRDLETRVH